MWYYAEMLLSIWLVWKHHRSLRSGMSTGIWVLYWRYYDCPDGSYYYCSHDCPDDSYYHPDESDESYFHPGD